MENANQELVDESMVVVMVMDALARSLLCKSRWFCVPIGLGPFGVVNDCIV